jgi:hypothetical protein
MILREYVEQLGKEFGRITKWQYYCKLNKATTEEEKIKFAIQVLEEPISGSVAESFSYWLKIKNLDKDSLPQRGK